MRFLRSDRGQAGLEYLAVLGVVGAALAATLAGAVPGAGAIPRGVRSTFERAFCLVSGGDCLGGRPRPCVVRADRRSRERSASIVAVRLADGRTLTREERSDGSVVVTVEDGARIGGALTLGGELTVAGRGIKAGAELGAHGRGETGRRYVLADGAAADRLIARLAGETGGAGGVARHVAGVDDDDPVPDEEWWAVGKGGEGEAALRGLGLKAAAELRTSDVAGIRRGRDGSRTVVLRSDGELAVVLTAPLVDLLGARLPASRSIELRFGADGRAESLTVRVVRGAGADAKVGPLQVSGGRVAELDARLDLADPQARAAADDLLGALRAVSPGRVLAAGRALGARLADRARIDVRVYATTRSSRRKGATAGILGKLGYEVEEVHTTARLVDAAGREPGLGWARRLDCVSAGA